MSDKALDSALKKRNELASEINQTLERVNSLKKDLAGIDRFINDWYEYAGVEPPGDNLSVKTDGTTVKPARPNNPRKEDVAIAARKIIAKYGHPLSQKELLQALDDAKVIIQGTDRNKVLSTMLWRTNDQVVRLKGYGYWLPERPWLDANYYPEETEEENA